MPDTVLREIALQLKHIADAFTPLGREYAARRARLEWEKAEREAQEQRRYQSFQDLMKLLEEDRS